MGRLLLSKTKVNRHGDGLKRNETVASGFTLEERVEVAAGIRVGAVALKDVKRLTSPEKIAR